MRHLHALLMGMMALLVLASIILGASSPEDNRECDSCHMGPRPEGGYGIRLPEVIILCPEEVIPNGSFQLLVRLSEDEPYEVSSALAWVDMGGLPGAVIDTNWQYLVFDGEVWSALFRIRDVSEEGSIHIRIDLLLHYDHPDPEESDLGTYSLEYTRAVGVAEPAEEPANEVTEEVGGSNDSGPIEGLALVLPLILAALLLRRRVP